jgi:hypothetical protein
MPGRRHQFGREPVLGSGLDDDANALLVAELQKSKSPYYFMLDLADLAQKAGREKEAVDWLAQAYGAAKGPATRFQWGASYLLGLLEMTPDDTQRIDGSVSRCWENSAIRRRVLSAHADAAREPERQAARVG